MILAICFVNFYYLKILKIVFMCIAFHMLSSTAGDYLAPAVSKISESLGLSETLAGVTLVAFGYLIY